MWFPDKRVQVLTEFTSSFVHVHLSASANIIPPQQFRDKNNISNFPTWFLLLEFPLMEPPDCLPSPELNPGPIAAQKGNCICTQRTLFAVLSERRGHVRLKSPLVSVNANCHDSRAATWLVMRGWTHIINQCRRTHSTWPVWMVADVLVSCWIAIIEQTEICFLRCQT